MFMKECHDRLAQSAGVKGTNVLVGFLVLTLIFILVVAAFEAKEISSDDREDEGGVDGHDDVFNNAPNNTLIHNGTLHTKGSLNNRSQFEESRQTPSRMV